MVDFSISWFVIAVAAAVVVFFAAGAVVLVLALSGQKRDRKGD
jgi:hypothetical protein